MTAQRGWHTRDFDLVCLRHVPPSAASWHLGPLSRLLLLLPLLLLLLLPSATMGHLRPPSRLLLLPLHLLQALSERNASGRATAQKPEGPSLICMSAAFATKGSLGVWPTALAPCT
jgi:hypothetical protein